VKNRYALFATILILAAWVIAASPGAQFGQFGSVFVQHDLRVDGASDFNSAVEIDGVAKIGDVAGGNYTQIGSDGTLTLVGEATVFDDIRVPVSSTRAGGTKDPDFAVWKTDGSSQGVFVQWFDKAAEEELYFSMQLPHSWKTGTDIEPHVHWIPKADGSAGAVVNWGLECNWTAIGSTGITTTIIYSSTNHAGDTTLVADKHYLSDLGMMDGSAITGVSSMAVCRVFRDATGALATDDYDNDAGLLEIDFHYEIDAIGSGTEYEK